MSYSCSTVLSTSTPSWSQTVIFYTINFFSSLRIFTMMLFAFYRIIHLTDQIINEKHFQFNRRIIYRNWQIIGNIVTESSDSTIVIWSYPFTYYIRESINQHLYPCLDSVLEEKVLARFLGKTIFRCPKPSRQCCLQAT